MPSRLHDSVRSFSDGQAEYVLDRLIADGRITREDIAHYANDIHREIGEIEQRLATLRAAAADRETKSSPTRETPAAPAPSEPLRPRRRRRGNRLAGSYMGYMRQVAPADKPRYQAIKQQKGYEAAIAAMKADLGK